jgi:hypothetical protein
MTLERIDLDDVVEDAPSRWLTSVPGIGGGHEHRRVRSVCADLRGVSKQAGVHRVPGSVAGDVSVQDKTSWTRTRIQLSSLPFGNP